MGITPAEVKVILDKSYQGFTSEQTNKVYIADNIHKTNSELANTIGNETSDVADMQRDAGVEKTKNYKANRDEYSTQIGNLTEELLNNQYSTNTGSDLKSVVNNKVGTNLNKPNELNTTVINNTREFGKLDKGKGAHRQLNNSEIEFLQNKDNIKKFAIVKYGKNYTSDDLQFVEYSLTQEALRSTDKLMSLIVGTKSNKTAKEFLEKYSDEFKVKGQQEFNSGYTNGEARIYNLSEEDYNKLKNLVNKNIIRNLPKEALFTTKKFGNYLEKESLGIVVKDIGKAIVLSPEAVYDGVVNTAKSGYDAFSTIDTKVSDRLDGIYGKSGSNVQTSISKTNATFGILGLACGIGAIKSGVKDGTVVKTGVKMVLSPDGKIITKTDSIALDTNINSI